MDDCPLVMVEWEDSAQPIASWQWLSDCRDFNVVKCTSVGWLICDTPDVKALAPNLGELGASGNLQASGIIRIPTRCVVRVMPLKEDVIVDQPLEPISARPSGASSVQDLRRRASQLKRQPSSARLAREPQPSSEPAASYLASESLQIRLAIAPPQELNEVGSLRPRPAIDARRPLVSRRMSSRHAISPVEAELKGTGALGGIGEDRDGHQVVADRQLPAVERRAAGDALVKGMLKAEIKRRNMTYEHLSAKLAEIGVSETATNLRISRGGFSAVFFVQCLRAIGCQSLAL